VRAVSSVVCEYDGGGIACDYPLCVREKQEVFQTNGLGEVF
jgi:hypothetical protein